MIAHVLFNLLNGLRKRNKMRGLPNILSPIHVVVLEQDTFILA